MAVKYGTYSLWPADLGRDNTLWNQTVLLSVRSAAAQTLSRWKADQPPTYQPVRFSGAISVVQLDQVSIVLFTVPAALAGGLWLVWLLGESIWVATVVGFIALFGVAAANSGCDPNSP